MTGIKLFLLSVIGGIGGFIIAALGGWSETMTALMIFMACDIITGLMAAIFLKSQKTISGGLSSKTMTKGLCRKGAILVMVLLAAQLDIVLGIEYIRDGVIIAFCANELISIIENVGLLGLPIPAVITSAIDLLNKKSPPREGDPE